MGAFAEDEPSLVLLVQSGRLTQAGSHCRKSSGAEARSTRDRSGWLERRLARVG
jgi:hypothetical protein